MSPSNQTNRGEKIIFGLGGLALGIAVIVANLWSEKIGSAIATADIALTLIAAFYYAGLTDKR